MRSQAYHMIARPAANAIASESPVLVYETDEFKQLSGITNPAAPTGSQD